VRGSTFSGALATALVVLGCLAPAVAGAEGKVRTQVRVVTHEGRIVADRFIATGSTQVPTSARATCFGGSPTDGTRLVEGATALGALADLSRKVEALRPMLVTNAFDFGLGLCSVGDSAPSGEEWWALKVNGVASSTGGDTTFIEDGDDVLWFMAATWTAPLREELRLSAPPRPGGRGLVRVQVEKAAADGRSSPLAGVRVYAGRSLAGTTNRRGRLAIRPPRGSGRVLRLVARLGGYIPSNRAVVRLGR